MILLIIPLACIENQFEKYHNEGVINLTKVLFYTAYYPENDAMPLIEEFPGLHFEFCSDLKNIEEKIKDAEIFITIKLTEKMIYAAPRLKWVQSIRAGIDDLPLEKMKDMGIILTSGKGIHRVHMAEYAIAAMIMMARNFPAIIRNKQQKKWDRSPAQDQIEGTTVGILGLGAIGREIAKKANLMGMKVIGTKQTAEKIEYVDRIYASLEMEEIFRQSEYVINLLPHTPETEKIVDSKCFDLMKKTCCFINMGRGKTVNEDDLVKALRTGRLRAFFSDVFYTEPLPEDSPLWEMENVFITPHICGESVRYLEKALEIIRHNLKVYLDGKGEMVNLIDLGTEH